jgi:hypothetical protein
VREILGNVRLQLEPLINRVLSTAQPILKCIPVEKQYWPWREGLGEDDAFQKEASSESSERVEGASNVCTASAPPNASGVKV